MRGKINLRYLVFIAATAALGGLLLGFDIAIITGAGPFLLDHFHLNDLQLGWAFSSLLFGAVLGAIGAGKFADRWGRKNILLWVALLFAATSIATALAPSFVAFIVARVAGGVAIGAASLLSPIYVAEVSPPTIRGRMGTLYQMAIVVGILISYGINYLLRNTGPSNWRWMFLTGAVPSLVFFGLMFLAPETPRYLLMAGKRDQAMLVLNRIGGDQSAAFVVGEIMTSLAQKQASWRGLFRPGVRRAVIASLVLAVLVQVSGINTIIDYAPAIFRSAGWKIDTALFSTFIVGLTNFAFTILSFLMIDRWGRKPLYIVGSLGMCAALVALAISVIEGEFHGAIVLALVLGYLAFFASCIGPVFWTLLPEIFPTDIRSRAMTLPVLTQWVANAVVVLFFPLAFDRIGKPMTFGFLAAMALAQAFFAWYVLPETKDKPLEEIEEFWYRAKVGGNLEYISASRDQ